LKPTAAPPKRRGRHAKPGQKLEALETFSVPLHQRFGFRPFEFAALLGVSKVTVWRWIRDGKIEVVDKNGMKFVTRSFAIKAGFIDE
jgi:excisionase family DNA binding protein